MPAEIVIVGGGIVGLCTALYLIDSQGPDKDIRVTLIETAAIGYNVSGRSAGFISGSPSWHKLPNRDLARLSAEEWDRLVTKFDGAGSFGYRPVEVATLLVSSDEFDELDQEDALETPGESAGEYFASASPSEQQWCNGELSDLASAANSAVVLPHLFCSRIYQYCAQKGLRTITASPTGRTDKMIHTSIGEDVPYDVLCITAGAWTSDVCVTLGLPPVAITGGPGHYVQIQPGYIPGGLREIPQQVLFAGIGDCFETAAENLAALDVHPWFVRLPESERRNGMCTTLQLFPRGHQIYIAGENNLPGGTEQTSGCPTGLLPSPRDASNMVDKHLIDRITRAASVISPALDVNNGARIVRAGVEYRPTTPDRAPIVGQIADSVFVCSGHGAFGISLGPGSGRILSEFVLAALSGEEPNLSADISMLSPHRFSPEATVQYSGHTNPATTTWSLTTEL